MVRLKADTTRITVRLKPDTTGITTEIAARHGTTNLTTVSTCGVFGNRSNAAISSIT
jgi:predicted ThiF/HesA family dinucleotide-utilizing enzyme